MPGTVEWLYEQLKEQYADNADNVLSGLASERITSLRVNTLKTDTMTVRNELHDSGLESERVAFYEDALVLPARSEPALRKTSMYGNGEIYLQSLSAMIPPLLIGAQEGEDILDMCAAPGGKTGQIIQLTSGRAMLTACEPDRIRCERMKSNLCRLGCDRVNVMNTDARKLDDFLKFDRILLDAPCSGSGTLKLDKDGNMNSAFSEKLVVNSARLQNQLIKKACSLLKRGGTLVYSTCSVLRQENEDRVMALRNEKMTLQPITREMLPGVPVLENRLPGTLTVPPGPDYEGFFIAVLKKQG